MWGAGIVRKTRACEWRARRRSSARLPCGLWDDGFAAQRLGKSPTRSLRQLREDFTRIEWAFRIISTAARSAALVEEERSYGRIFGQADGAIVGVCGLTGLSEALQKVRANGPVGLVERNGVRVDRIENGESAFGSVCFGNCSSVSDPCAEGGRYTEQLFVEQNDGRPIDAAGMCALGVYGLDGRFELESPDALLLEGCGQMTFGFFYQRKRPVLWVLLGKRDVSAVRASSRGAAPFAMEHESEQTLHFSFAGHELQKDAREPQGFFGQVATAVVGAHHVVPADAERSVNRF